MKRKWHMCGAVLVVFVIMLAVAGCGAGGEVSSVGYETSPVVYVSETEPVPTPAPPLGDELPADNILPEWVSHHPWRPHYEIGYMPVFRNPFYMLPPGFAQDGHRLHFGNALTEEEMTAQAKELLTALGMEVTGAQPSQNHIWARGITATADEAEATVEPQGFVQIHFPRGIALPEGLSLAWGDATREAAIEYAAARFASLLGFPAATGAGIVERILDYHFNSIRFLPGFAPDADGKLREINFSPPAHVVLADKIGYFPIITPSQGVARMLAGYGSFGVDMGQIRPTADDIIDTRLVYFGHILGRNLLFAFAPWYEFIVHTADTHHLQSFFVPAIHPDYLEANPAWAVYPHQ